MTMCHRLTRVDLAGVLVAATSLLAGRSSAAEERASEAAFNTYAVIPDTADHTARIGDMVVKISQLSSRGASAQGLSAINALFDSQHRLTDLVGDAGILVSFRYGPQGIREIDVPAHFSLQFIRAGSGKLRQILRSGRGHHLKETLVPGEYGPLIAPPVSLNAVVSRLGLDYNWSSNIRVEGNELLTVSDLSGRALAYVLTGMGIEEAPLNVGFDSQGNALFYDLDVTPLIGFPGPDSAGIPSRVIITADGRVQLDAPRAARGAMFCVWSDVDERVLVQTLNGPVNGPAENGSSSRISPLVLYLCDPSTVCSWDSVGNGSCTTTYRWCDSGDGGGGGGTVGDGGGGTGGGGGGTGGGTSGTGSDSTGTRWPAEAVTDRSLARVWAKPRSHGRGFHSFRTTSPVSSLTGELRPREGRPASAGGGGRDQHAPLMCL